MVPPPPRPGTFSPNQPQALQTGISHSPHPSQTGGLSAGASPSTSSPTGTSVSKISVAQVYLLLSTIKEDKEDPTKWDQHTEQLRKVPAYALPPLRRCLGRAKSRPCYYVVG